MLRDDHPRPDFYRENWYTLVGEWEFHRDSEDRGMEEEWYLSDAPFEDTIQVPFPWQSRLSTVEDTHYTGAAWYRTSFHVEDPRDLWIYFGAVDYECSVWMNGVYIGSHAGGYDPFSFPVSEALSSGRNTLVVRAVDPADISQIPHGKQGGDWYTRVSGIWQPVILERRPPLHCTSAHVRPKISPPSIEIDLELARASADALVELQVLDADGHVVALQREPATEGKLSAAIDVPNGTLWTPEHPYLYQLDIRTESRGREIDKVTTYFGLRGFSAEEGSFYLNGEEIYLRGVLAQGYHPDGLYTYPSVETMEEDLRTAKEAGFNLVRTHIKPEEPRIFHLADRLGLLIWSEPANFGDSGFTAAAREQLKTELCRHIERDFNHPSIVIWGCINETWGLRTESEGAYTLYHDAERREYVRELYDTAKELDKTRLIVDNSPCNGDHIVSDINDWHAYWSSYRRWKANMAAVAARTYPGSQWNWVPGYSQGSQPMMNSECGAVSAHVGERDTSLPLKYVINEIRKHDICKGYVYTELQDIEWEKNGIVRYDRSPKQFGYDLRDVNAADVIVVDAAPVVSLSEGERTHLPLFLSIYSACFIDTEVTLSWQVEGCDEIGNRVRGENGTMAFPVSATGNTDCGTVALTSPAPRFSGVLRLWAEDPHGNTVARNEVNLVSESAAAAGAGKLQPNEHLIEASPESYTAAEWSGGSTVHALSGEGRTVFSAEGSGFVRYYAELPPAVDPGAIKTLELLAELSAHLPAPEQTDSLRRPTHLRLSVCGVTCGEWVLPDAPADSRGRLSNAHGFLDGAYGYLKRAVISAESLDRIRAELTAYHRFTLDFIVPREKPVATNGLMIYGTGLGRFPVGIALRLRE